MKHAGTLRVDRIGLALLVALFGCLAGCGASNGGGGGGGSAADDDAAGSAGDETAGDSTDSGTGEIEPGLPVPSVGDGTEIEAGAPIPSDAGDSSPGEASGEGTPESHRGRRRWRRTVRRPDRPAASTTT